jgi:uracil phosphoribosyltransferase
MKNLTIVTHPLIQRDLSILRDRRSSSDQFRRTLSRIAALMAYEVTKDLQLESFVLTTPLEKTRGYRLSQELVLVPVLRAGLGMVEGFLNFLPEAKVGHIGLYRDEETLKPVDYYSKFPRTLKRSLVFLIDPMLATGGSASAAVRFMKAKQAKWIRLVCLVAAPEGVRRLAREHPDVAVYTASLDRRLNKRGYILPGLGDAGDRIFGTS